MKPKSLMTQYLEGVLVGRELRDMLNDYAVADRFDRELASMDAETERQNSLIAALTARNTAIYNWDAEDGIVTLADGSVLGVEDSLAFLMEQSLARSISYVHRDLVAKGLAWHAAAKEKDDE